MTRDQILREVNEITQRIASLATLLRQQFNPADAESIECCVGDAKAIRANVDDLGRVLNKATFNCPEPASTTEDADVLHFPRGGA